MRCVRVVRQVSLFFALVAGSSVALAADYVCTTTGTGESRRLAPEVRRSLVITSESHPNVFRSEEFLKSFSLAGTLKQILASAVNTDGLSSADAEARRDLASGTGEQVALLTSLLRSFRSTDRMNTDSEPGVPMPVAFRPGEAALDPLKLLNIDKSSPRDVMRPVALFNRIDLAPDNWSYCGEHRIVFAKTDETGEPVGGRDRLLLIFEAALDNPDPQNAKAGCGAVARFWTGLGAVADDDVLRDRLVEFYFKGLPGQGTPDFKPVVHYSHFAVPFGQVRGNLFARGGGDRESAWMLREWRIAVPADRVPTFVSATVKSNPHPLLYGADPAPDPAFGDLRPTFQKDLLFNTVRELIQEDLAASGTPDGNTLLGRVGARFQNRYNAFESVSQAIRNPLQPSAPPRAEDDPLIRAAGTGLIGRINAELRNYRLPEGLTADHILARAGAVSCGGCHDFSVGQKMSPKVEWPAVAGGFVHVTEKGALSPALDAHFLPDRCANLKGFIDELEPQTMATAPARPSGMALPQVARVRELAARVQGAESRFAASAASAELDTAIQAARRIDQQTPGGLVTFRRPH